MGSEVALAGAARLPSYVEPLPLQALAFDVADLALAYAEAMGDQLAGLGHAEVVDLADDRRNEDGRATGGTALAC